MGYLHPECVTRVPDPRARLAAELRRLVLRDDGAAAAISVALTALGFGDEAAGLAAAIFGISVVIVVAIATTYLPMTSHCHQCDPLALSLLLLSSLMPGVVVAGFQRVGVDSVCGIITASGRAYDSRQNVYNTITQV